MVDIAASHNNLPGTGHPAEGSGTPLFYCLRDITLTYQSSGQALRVLEGLDFDVQKGETVAIIGASGIGKSTLLHIMGALDRPTRGQLLLEGEDIFQYDDNRLARFRNRQIGFVFQFHHLLPEFSALENAAMPGLIAGMDRETAAVPARQLLERVGLKDRLHHRVSELSGGEQQRVALARALLLQPAVLLADEPTGNLDQANSDQVHQLLLALNQEFNMTMVVVTHNMELAALMARRVTIENGRITDLT